MGMRGLNSKEVERSGVVVIYLSALLSLPADLMDTMFVNHQYGSIHWSWVLAVRLAGIAVYLLVCLAGRLRPLQRVAFSLFLCVCAGTAILSRFGLQTHDGQVIARLIIFTWWAGLLLLIGDWINHKLGLVQPAVRKTASEAPPDIRADKARHFMLERLGRQAAAEHLTLSELEVQFLDYSRITEEEKATALEEEFFRSHDYSDFKNSIRVLARNAVRQDREADTTAQKQYYRLLRDLKRGKHDQQLALFIERGILDARTGLEELRDYAFYTLIGLSVAAAIYVLTLVFTKL